MDITRYGGLCPCCLEPAYIGANDVKCSNPECKKFEKPSTPNTCETCKDIETLPKGSSCESCGRKE